MFKLGSGMAVLFPMDLGKCFNQRYLRMEVKNNERVEMAKEVCKKMHSSPFGGHCGRDRNDRLDNVGSADAYGGSCHDRQSDGCVR